MCMFTFNYQYNDNDDDNGIFYNEKSERNLVRLNHIEQLLLGSKNTMII